MTVLEALKKREPESQHHLILIVNDEDAKRVMVGWTMYHPRVRDTELKDGEDCFVVAKKIWPRVDLEKLSRLSGVPWGQTDEVFSRLREARLVYPDGTVHTEALAIVRGEVGAYVKGLVGKR